MLLFGTRVRTPIFPTKGTTRDIQTMETEYQRTSYLDVLDFLNLSIAHNIVNFELDERPTNVHFEWRILNGHDSNSFITVLRSSNDCPRTSSACNYSRTKDLTLLGNIRCWQFWFIESSRKEKGDSLDFDIPGYRPQVFRRHAITVATSGPEIKRLTPILDRSEVDVVHHQVQINFFPTAIPRPVAITDAPCPRIRTSLIPRGKAILGRESKVDCKETARNQSGERYMCRISWSIWGTFYYYLPRVGCLTVLFGKDT